MWVASSGMATGAGAEQPRTALELVASALLRLVLELNTLLPQAARHAVDPADRVACEHGTHLAYELSCCWDGRLGSFLSKSRDLSSDRPSRRHPGRNAKRKRARKKMT